MLARRLRVPSPDPMEDALARATLLQQASKAGFKVLQKLEYDDPQGVVKLVKQRIEQRNFAAWERLGTQADMETPSELYARVRLAMLEAERTRVLEIRDAGQVASEVVSEVLAMLDVEESMIDVAQASREELKTEYSRVRRTGASCDHLDSRPVRGGRAGAVPGLPDVRRRGLHVGLAAAVPGVRQHRLLRLLGDAARHRPLPRVDPPGHAVGRAAGGLALVLRAPRHRLTPAPLAAGRAATVAIRWSRRSRSDRHGTP